MVYGASTYRENTVYVIRLVNGELIGLFTTVDEAEEYLSGGLNTGDIVEVVMVKKFNDAPVA